MCVCVCGVCCVCVCALVVQSTEQVAAFCRSLHDMSGAECVSSWPSPDSPLSPPASAPRLQLSDADKLRKVICELVGTERTYVKVGLDLSEDQLSVSPYTRSEK